MQPDKKIKSDLEYLAEQGYNAVPGAEKDVDDLKQKIRTRTGTSTFLSTTFIAITVGLLLAITVFFTIYNKPFLSPSRTQELSNNTEIKETSKDLTLDTIQIIHRIKKEQIIEKFIEPKTLDSLTQWGKAEHLERINEITLALDTTFFDRYELKYSPNAPYIYLYDYKIANYNTYYFTVKQRVVVHGGLEASVSDNNTNNDANIPYREYFLHDVIKDAMQAFNQKKYAHCVTLLDLISEFSKNDVNCDFYRGMSYFYMQDNEQAYKFLKSAQANKINVFQEETCFYLAQSAIKTKRINEAKKLLAEAASLNGFYSQKAKVQLSGL